MQEEKNKSNYEGPSIPFYIHILKEISVFLFLVGALITLSVLFPPELDVKADPFVTPEHIKPEWYFLAEYQFLKAAEKLSFIGSWAPKLIGVIGQGAVVFLILILPLIDRNPERSPSKRKGMITVGILFIFSLAVFTVWGYFS